MAKGTVSCFKGRIVLFATSPDPPFAMPPETRIGDATEVALAAMTVDHPNGSPLHTRIAKALALNDNPRAKLSLPVVLTPQQSC